MSSRQFAAEREVSALGIFTHATVGKANFHLNPDDVGDVGIKVYEEGGTIVIEAESDDDSSNTTGVCLDLSVEEADALTSQLSEVVRESRRRDQEGA